MAIVMSPSTVEGLIDAVDALREWQRDGAPMQLHPGDVGWFWRFGPEATAAAIRTWRRDGEVVAVGLLDGGDVLRLTLAPDANRDEEIAAHIVADVADPTRGVLGTGRVNVEVPVDTLVRELLSDLGWNPDEPWTPLSRDLSEPVEDAGVRIETVGPEHVTARVAVQRAAFERSTFTEGRWRAMAAGIPYSDARCLVAFDSDDVPVAGVTVWSAGVGRPGLLEPMGVHPDHRGHGFGRAITLAAAAALRELGSSSAFVCTPSAYVGAVATYESAGFEKLPEVRDHYRDE